MHAGRGKMEQIVSGKAVGCRANGATCQQHPAHDLGKLVQHDSVEIVCARGDAIAVVVIEKQ